MLYTILSIAAVVLVVLVGLVALQPTQFKIWRRDTMAAPAADVFAQVNDFHNWRAWSPWEKMDPNLERTYEGPPAGVGAKYSWVGNKKVGEGRMTIVESRPSDRIRIALEFLKPFKADNTAEFSFQSEGAHTAVTWSMSGNRNFMFKAMGLVMNMDKLVGADFERGLANLKSIVERG